VFHSVLGVRAGITDAADRLRAAGYRVRVVDQYDGRVFDDYDEAGRFVASLGFPELMGRALDGVADLPDGFIAMGFSNGGGMATWVALHRPVAAVVACSGALPLDRIGADGWPPGVPAQLHYTVDDPRKLPGSVDSLMRSVNEAGADAEYVQYPGSGHLFTDPGLSEEFDPGATERFWSRVLAFCATRTTAR
jgi:dienelactone hydrolase